MLAAIFNGPGDGLILEERPIPEIQKPDDVILEVGGVGICGSDLSILEGPHKHPCLKGVIFGHEFAGRIAQKGPAVKGLEIGQHVAINPTPGCGHCYMCRNGYPNACIPLFDNPLAPEKGWPNCIGQWFDGGLARYVRVPEHFCYQIAANVPMKHAAIFEPLGVVVNALSKVKPQAGELGVVLGGGPIGLIATSLLKIAGASKIIASEAKPKRRELLGKCGADLVIDPSKDDLVKVVERETRGLGAHVVVECVGTLLPVALEVLAFGGRIAQIGIPSSDIKFRPFQIIAKEASIYGSWLMKQSMDSAVRLLESGLLLLDTIVTNVLPLEKVNEGIKIARQGEGGKIVIVPNEF
jgi:Threonine dehydrogenase and related Zn-dependent dehydrogenases